MMEEGANMKSVKERIRESMEIHKQLEILGAFIADKNRVLIKSMSNEFVHNGTISTATLNLENAKAKVVFTSKPQRKSGVILEASAPIRKGIL